jgi:hypothetical protein
VATRRPLQIERDEPAPALSDRAIDNLRYIRETMERAGTFTALSGRGIALTGIIAFVASALAGPALGSPRWLAAWIGAAASAMLVSASFTLRKADASAVRISGALGRKLALAFFPALVAGAVITAVALRAGWYVALPGLWLITYGAAVMAGGALSAPVIPVMGASFMLLGAVALGAPLVLANAWSELARSMLLNGLLALGFGGLHLGFGWAIARRYGG